MLTILDKWMLVGMLCLALLLGLGAWKLKRWAHWKFFYGNKVEARIEQLEQRIEALEAHTHED
jgi:cytochrome oxidase assembly protein ShyY1